MARKKAHEWTWALYDGGRFGQGAVLCRDGAVVKVWLPREHVDRARIKAGLASLGAKAHEGGTASEVARLLSGFFLKGEVPDGVAIDFRKAPEFFGKVYRELRKVSPGSVVTYGELARRAGSPKATRAVGQAMSRNELPLLVPCHRVISADHSLGSYGGGVEMKRWLLEKEGALHLIKP